VVPPARILIVDDAPAVREALRWALEDEEDLAVVGEAGDGNEAVARAAALAPDVVILDIALPGQDGYAVARSLKALSPPPLVIFLTVHCDPIFRQQGLAAGGDGFAEKASGWPSLITLVRRSLAARPHETATRNERPCRESAKEAKARKKDGW
jgi:DNA-binding NarL/FixJ family response regulator